MFWRRSAGAIQPHDDPRRRPRRSRAGPLRRAVRGLLEFGVRNRQRARLARERCFAHSKTWARRAHRPARTPGDSDSLLLARVLDLHHLDGLAVRARAGPIGRARRTEGEPAAQQAQQTQQSGVGRTHTVQRGETLTGIAQKYYGRASEYQKIFDANRDKLSDPDKVREGTNLVIPA